ncbi:MAG: hypothetical protein K1X79_07565 [Oligoflexia bacterium]|nr:hypothetical protein [Oligoflexia bacterium]
MKMRSLDQKGATVPEYVVLFSLIALIALPATDNVGAAVSDLMKCPTIAIIKLGTIKTGGNGSTPGTLGKGLNAKNLCLKHVDDTDQNVYDGSGPGFSGGL